MHKVQNIDILAEPHEGFAGHVSPMTAHNCLAANPSARLIDVRTRPEWNFVGIPLIIPTHDADPASQVLFIEWQFYPAMEKNPDFLATAIDALAPSNTPDAPGASGGVPEASGGSPGASGGSPVFTICRSGVRSAAAARALTQAGFTAFNVAFGFEGDLDAHAHRNQNGWKKSSLSWRQT